MHDKYWLSRGSHDSPEEGLCVMELAALLAGEPHSDKPECVSRFLIPFAASLNDALGDKKRQRLRPYAGRMIGTRDDGLDEQRARMAEDWIRTHTPPQLASWFAEDVDVTWDVVWDATRPAVKKSAFALLDRMLPLEAVQLPVAADAALVCEAV